MTNKTDFIPYIEARALLESRFPDVTDGEIALWLRNDDIHGRSNQSANAKKINYYSLELDFKGKTQDPEAKWGKMMEFLNRFFYDPQELATFSPYNRYRRFAWVADYAKRLGIDEDNLMGILVREYKNEEPQHQLAWNEPSPYYLPYHPNPNGDDIPNRIKEILHDENWINQIAEFSLLKMLRSRCFASIVKRPMSRSSPLLHESRPDFKTPSLASVRAANSNFPLVTSKSCCEPNNARALPLQPAPFSHRGVYLHSRRMSYPR